MCIDKKVFKEMLRRLFFVFCKPEKIGNMHKENSKYLSKLCIENKPSLLYNIYKDKAFK